LTVTDNSGATASASFTVTVGNVPPTLTLAGAGAVAEGAAYTLQLAASDPGQDTIDHWTVHWGDGAVQTVAGNPPPVPHAYADGPNSYTLSATATDADGTWAAGNTVGVSVTNVAPVLPLEGAAHVDEGSPYVLTLGAVTDPGQDTVSRYTVHWGDGQDS